MNSLETRFIEPLDVLYLRGNALFGDPGSFGEAMIPPWPSVAAGALRSRMLVDDGVDMTIFGRGEINHATLGTPQQPGSFCLRTFQLAQRQPNGEIHPLFPLPADLVISESAAQGALQVSALTPTQVNSGVASSFHMPLLPVLAEKERSKPSTGYWLKPSGWQRYLQGALPSSGDLIHASELWKLDARVGVGLDTDKGSTAEGKLFSAQAIVFEPQVGFIVVVSGAVPPSAGTLRFGGDGRAAAVTIASMKQPQTDLALLMQVRRCRLILSSPGLFTEGWLPTGCTREGEHYWLNAPGIRARLVSAAVPRAEVISGWDIAAHQPKPAQRIAPTGSVYWLDELDADIEALSAWLMQGLWSTRCEDEVRRAEGFNRFNLAAY